MRHLTIAQVLDLHRRLLEQSGGIAGLRDRAGLESAVAQPWMTFGGADLYPTLAAKAGALCHALVQNHPFNDGNKRVGHAAMETMLVMNGFELDAGVDEQEATILAVASGQMNRPVLIAWVAQHLIPRR
jgi:death-on-curing protein